MTTRPFRDPCPLELAGPGQGCRIKFVAPRPFADPAAAARKLLEIANAVQDGRIHIEKLNGPFLFKEGGTPAQYSAGLDHALSQGWLWKHGSGTYVKVTQAGVDLFA